MEVIKGCILPRKSLISSNILKQTDRMYVQDPLNLSQDDLLKIQETGSSLIKKHTKNQNPCLKWIEIGVYHNGKKREYFTVTTSPNIHIFCPNYVIELLIDSYLIIPGRNKSFPAFYVIYDALEFRNHSFSTAVYAAQICKSLENRSTLPGKKEKQAEYKEDERNIDDLLAEIEGTTKKAAKNRPSTTASSRENPATVITARSVGEAIEAEGLETPIVAVDSRNGNSKPKR